MEKSDLECGNVVELRSGDKLLFCWHFVDKVLVYLDGHKFATLDTYLEDLTSIDDFRDLDIMKVYKDYTCKELLWERKEKPKLTEDEKVILRNVPKYYKWIARDNSGSLYVYASKPKKRFTTWESNGAPLIPFAHIFKFIKWEDDEPYSIEDLLKGEEK